MSRPPTIEDRLILACAATEPDLPVIRDLAAQDPNWTTFLRKIERWGLATAVYVNVKKSAELPGAIVDRLRPLHRKEAIYAIARREQLRATLLRLSEKDIPVIVPPPGDADLLVHARDRDEAVALARSIPRSSGAGRLAIRVQVAQLAAADIPIEDVWVRARRAQIESVDTLVPSAEDVVLQLALDLVDRIANRDGSGAGVRALCELGSACEREENAIDWRRLVMRARDYQVTAPLAHGLRLARDLIAANLPSGVLENLSAGLPLADQFIDIDIACAAIFCEGADASDAATKASVVGAAASIPMSDRSTDGSAGAVAVTYDPTTTDGVGSQLLRIYGLYALSRALQVKYVHTPIELVGYQGFLPLLTGRNDADFTPRYNAFFTLPSDDFDLASCERVRIHILTREKVEEHQRRAAESGRPVLLQAIHHYGYTDRHPATFHAIRAVSPYREFRASGPIRVCIHVRRGDNSVPGRTDVENRLLPNSYYLRACGTVLDALRREGVPFIVRLHTEVPTRRCTLYPDTPGLYFRLNEPATVNPSGYTLDEFDALPNLEMRINVDAREALDDFATADVLILSRSSLGYVAGLLNPHGVVVYAPWWHPALPEWLVADEHGNLDGAQVGTRIAAQLRRR